MSELKVVNFSKSLPYVPENDGMCAVLFKLTNCSWCQKMEPVWSQLNSSIGFMKLYTFTVDRSTENSNHWKKIIKSLKNGHKIQGFPLVMLYSPSGRVILHTGYSSFDEMKDKLIQFAKE